MTQTRTSRKPDSAAARRVQRRAVAQIAEYIHDLSTHAGRGRQPRARLHVTGESIAARSS